MNQLLKRIDPFIVFLVGAVGLASALPVRGAAAGVFDVLTDGAIGLLFFLNGAKLSTRAIVAGIGHWRLHLLVLLSTFVLFPALGLLTRWVAAPAVDQSILAGVVYLCLLPSTVQSSIAFTVISGGNVPAAICSATLSNVLGVFITPVLASIFLDAHGGAGSGSATAAVRSILIQLMVPFIAGHLCRPLLIKLLETRKKIVSIVDRGSIVMVVYTAFSAAVIEGLWRKVSAEDLAVMLVINGVLLGAVVLTMVWLGKAVGFSREDQIALVFCGSKKSLVSGVPMAGVLFPPAAVGAMILPLMFFHQMQLMLCAFLAQRYAAERKSADPSHR